MLKSDLCFRSTLKVVKDPKVGEAPNRWCSIFTSRFFRQFLVVLLKYCPFRKLASIRRLTNFEALTKFGVLTYFGASRKSFSVPVSDQREKDQEVQIVATNGMILIMRNRQRIDTIDTMAEMGAKSYR